MAIGKSTSTVFTLFCALITYNLSAGNLEVSPSVTSSVIHVNRDAPQGNSLDGEVYSIQPALRLTYVAARGSAGASVNHRYLFKSPDDASDFEENYTSYQANGAFNLLSNGLRLNFGATRAHRAANSGNQLLNDAIVNDGDLATIENYRAGVFFSIPNPRYFNFQVSAQGNKSKSDRSSIGPEGLEAENYNASVRLTQGKLIKKLSWDLTSQYRKTVTGAGKDYDSSSASAFLGVPLFDNVRFVVKGNTEDYRFQQGTLLGEEVDDYYNYGAGLEWYSRSDRRITITFNRSHDITGETDEYLGGNISWAFSPRTSIKANYDRRYYGDSGALQFAFNNRKLRASVSYSEAITSYPRILLEENPLGTFVCPLGQVSLDVCYQPDTIDYIPGPDEQLLDLSEPVIDITNEIMLMKTWRAQLGYKARKLSINIAGSKGEREYLDSNRLQNFFTTNITASYALGRRTNINLSQSRSKGGLGISQDGLSQLGITVNSSVGITHGLSRKASISLTGRHTSRDGGNTIAAITDRRVTLSLTYQL